MSIKHLPIIINPASGTPEPVLSIFNQVFKDSEIKWDVLIVKKSGDAQKFTRELIEKKEQIIAVYGGDGTVMEVISELIGSLIPLVIMPGGTGNVMATDLGIPSELKDVCEMMKRETYKLRTIDIGEFKKRYFMVRACFGFEAEMVKGAKRETKNRWGRLAYFIGGIKAMKKLKLINYDIVIDGEKQTVKGISCIVANSGSTGFGDLLLAKHVDVSDGLLDLLVIKKRDLSLIQYIWRILIKGDPSENRSLVGHWQGKDIKVTAKPQQDVVCDGEILGKMPIHATVIPQAVQVVVPKMAK